MTFPGQGLSSGSGRFTTTRGRISGGSGTNGMSYPHPFFDVAHTYLPVTVKQLFRWCRYYFLTNPLINATVFKLSEYPITDIVVDHENPEVRRRWEEYFQEHLKYRPFQVECGLDYHTYGNCMVSLGFPFHKYLKCAHCDFQDRADKVRKHWKFTNLAFRLTCPKCKITAEAQAYDFYYKDASGIHPIRWNCEHIEVQYNDVTGKATYFYSIPPTVRNDVVVGKKDVVESIPQVFIQAMRQKKGVVFSQDNFFHMKRPSLAQQDRGWGIPAILPVLKDTFYLQLMKKAQEAILLEHIVPLRILFPQAASGSADPFTTINLTQWRDHVGAEIARWRQDNNYIPILPLPIGNQTIGGDGRALLLTQEISTWSEQIMSGMGVPREFLLGGMSYSGSNVSMRMLENAFIGFLLRHKQMANWTMKSVARYMDWPEAPIRFKPFKMADDIQRKAYLFQLNQAQKVSDSTLLADADLDQATEDEIMVRETAQRLEASKKQQMAMAEIQGESQVVMAKSQAKAQKVMAAAAQATPAPGEPGAAAQSSMDPAMQQQQQAPQQQQQAGPMGDMGSQLNQGQDLGVSPEQQQQGGAPMGVDIQQLAQQLAQQIVQLPPDQQQLALGNIKTQSPELAQMVEQLVNQMMQEQQQAQAGLGADGQAATQVDMRPLPEQKPPRRAAASV